MEYTISVLVENHAGVLSRVAGDERVMEQVKKQLNKQIDVIRVLDLTSKNPVERELALIKVTADDSVRTQIIEIVDIFRATIVDVSPKTVIIEATGETKKINALIKMLSVYGIKEIARTGKIALARTESN